MLAKVCSAAVNGIEAYPVEVEVNAGWGDTLVIIVGLPDAAVKESRDRVSTALTNSGYKFPMGRSTINLAPADVKKEGPSFDLPIAVGMLGLDARKTVLGLFGTVDEGQRDLVELDALELRQQTMAQHLRRDTRAVGNEKHGAALRHGL